MSYLEKMFPGVFSKVQLKAYDKSLNEGANKYAMALAFNRAKKDDMDPHTAVLFMLDAYNAKIVIRGIDPDTLKPIWVPTVDTPVTLPDQKPLPKGMKAVL